MEVASEEALRTAERFFDALVEGDSRSLWDLFSEQARAYIINIGHERGMDFDLASALRAGTAAVEDMEDFLADLLAGIRHDLTGVDLERLALESVAEPESPMRVRVTYLVELGPRLDELQPAIPAGSLVLVLEDEGWRVDRLVPRPGNDA